LTSLDEPVAVQFGEFTAELFSGQIGVQADCLNPAVTGHLDRRGLTVERLGLRRQAGHFVGYSAKNVLLSGLYRQNRY
jgi:hypothetical protein